MARAIMIQGTGSNVGKSMLVAGLARACTRRGLNVAPFKPQNMSNNAAVTADGGEIGRAQALQARAAGKAPHTDMNPVLLKPESETGAQVIVQGRVQGRWQARAYPERKQSLMHAVQESFSRLCAGADLVLVEGAGSPAEINLRQGDIANMGFAIAAGVPVVLVGDIDRGGVIAQIVGTQAVLAPKDAAQIKAFAINKFRGDARLFDDGLSEIETRTKWPSLGVIPWFTDAWRLPAEDAQEIIQRPGGDFIIAVPRLGRIANFDDLDPLSAEPDVTVRIISPGQPLPGDAGLIVIPGSKSTIADLAEFRANGWDIDLAAHIRRGGAVLGLCGGYQMLGRTLSDPGGVEGPQCTVPGLGHLAVDTVMEPHKRLSLGTGHHPGSGTGITGYEIHMGQTTGPDRARAWLSMSGAAEGASSRDGMIRGSYVHGLLSSDAFRAAYLAELGCASDLQFESGVDAALDALADHLETHMDLDRLLSLAAEVR
ncbi:cobyric acid synthase [Roseovarius sp. S4756]|uniref:cobyric acid synthase n=1 Tax=Roseovarius maritimus TaxID=3342637 RepID=UPI00372843A1